MSPGDCSARQGEREALSLRETKPWSRESMETRSEKEKEGERERGNERECIRSLGLQ